MSKYSNIKVNNKYKRKYNHRFNKFRLDFARSGLLHPIGQFPFFSPRATRPRRKSFNFHVLNYKYYKFSYLARAQLGNKKRRTNKRIKATKTFSTSGFGPKRFSKRKRIRKLRIPYRVVLFRRFRRNFLSGSRPVIRGYIPYKVRSKRKVSRKFAHTAFPFNGLQGLAAHTTRNRYFYKRRSIYNHFRYNFLPVRSQMYRQASAYFSKLNFYLHLRQTKNNLFFFLKTSKGRLLSVYTNGQTIYKGSRRTSPTASELAGKQVSKLLRMNKLTGVCLVFDTPLTSIVKAAVRGLAINLNFSGILANRYIAHNGIKARATRRV